MNILDRASVIQIMNKPKGFLFRNNYFAPAEVIIDIFEAFSKGDVVSKSLLEYAFTKFPVIRLPEEISEYEKAYITQRSKAKGLMPIDYWAYLYSTHFNYPLIAGSKEKEKRFLKTGIVTANIFNFARR